MSNTFVQIIGPGEVVGLGRALIYAQGKKDLTVIPPLMPKQCLPPLLKICGPTRIVFDLLQRFPQITPINIRRS